LLLETPVRIDVAGVLQTGCFLCYLEDRFLYYDAYYSYCKIYVTVLTATVLTVFMYRTGYISSGTSSC